MKIMIFVLLAVTVLFGFFGLSFPFGGLALSIIVPALIMLCGPAGWALHRAIKPLIRF